MNRIQKTSLVILICVGGTLCAQTKNDLPLQKGISVQMAITSHATPMTEADYSDAWIVTVTSDGDLYFGVEAVTREDLAAAMKKRPRNPATKLYIKVDARASFSDMKAALAAARSNSFEEPVLLTSQQKTALEGRIVSPKGLKVRVMPSRNQEAIRVQLSAQGGQTSPSLTINGEVVAWPNLEATLKRQLQGQMERTVRVEASDDVPFAAIAHVLDEAKGDGATLALPSYHSL